MRHSIYHYLLNKLGFNKEFVNPLENIRGKEFEVNNYSISDFIYKKIIPIISYKPFPLSELQLMVAAAVWSRPKAIFEWGTHVGKSASLFYETSKAFSLGSKIYSIDLPDDVNHIEHPHKQRGRLVRNLSQVQLIQGDGVAEALKTCKKTKINNALFFLDGDHEYQGVRRELNLIINSVKKPSTLVHDTFFQSRESKYNIGPYKAVSEFLKKNQDFKSISTQTGLPGLTFLYKL